MAFVKGSASRQAVADAARALTARKPRVRYTAGADSFLVPFARRVLPDWVGLRVIRSHFDLE